MTFTAADTDYTRWTSWVDALWLAELDDLAERLDDIAWANRGEW